MVKLENNPCLNKNNLKFEQSNTIYLKTKNFTKWRRPAIEHRKLLQCPEILKISKITTTVGFVMGFHPFKWDSNNSRIIFLSTWSQRWRWIVMRMLTVTCVMTLGVDAFARLVTDGLRWYRWEDLYASVWLFGLLMPELFHYNSLRRGKVAERFFSAYTGYFKKVEAELARQLSSQKDRPETDTVVIRPINVLLLKMLFVAMFAVSLFVGVMGIIVCKFNVFYLMLPQMCTDTSIFFNYQSAYVAISLTIIQVILAFQIFGSIVVYVVTSIVASFVGSELLVKLRTVTTVPTRLPVDVVLAKSDLDWNQAYRCWQILTNLHYYWNCEVVLPAFIALVALESTIVIFSLISVTTRSEMFSIPFVLLLLVLCAANLIITAYCTPKVVSFTENSLKLVETRRRQRKGPNPLTTAILRAAPPLTIRVATFGILRRSIVTTTFDFEIDKAITLRLSNL